MKEFFFITAVFAAVFGLFVGAIYALESTSCGIKAEGLELNHDYGFFSGCRYDINGVLVPDDMIRITDTGHVIIQGEGE